MSKIIILILAGGKGSRMEGAIKQLLPWNGHTLLENTIEQAKMSDAHEVIVVLGANATLIKSRIKNKEVTFIDNRDWELGLGTSISCGIEYIQKEHSNTTGIMVLLADQPFIDSVYINKMIHTFLNKSYGLVTTLYGTKVGVPAVFGQNYFQELQLLNSDFGAKDLIKKNMHLNFSLDPQGKAMDIDTPEEYKALLKENYHRKK